MIPLYWDSQVYRDAAATAIQSVWRGCAKRTTLYPILVFKIIQRRAAIALQRWWRYTTRLGRRLRLLADISSVCRSVTSLSLYFDAWVYFQLLRNTQLPPVACSMSLFPECNCELKLSKLGTGFVFVPKDASAIFSPRSGDMLTNSQTITSDNKTRSTKARRRSIFSALERPSLADSSLEESCGKIDANTLPPISSCRVGFPQWFLCGTPVRSSELFDGEFSGDCILHDLVTWECSVSLARMVPPVPVQPTAPPVERTLSLTSKRPLRLLSKTPLPSLSNSSSRASHGTGSAEDAFIRVVQVTFKSVEEARRRCALIMLLTYDKSSWTSATPMPKSMLDKK